MGETSLPHEIQGKPLVDRRVARREEGVPYALIGGVAIQLHTRAKENARHRLAVPTYAHVPISFVEPGSSIPVVTPQRQLARPRSRTSQAADSGRFFGGGSGIADAVAHASVVDLEGVCSCARNCSRSDCPSSYGGRGTEARASKT